MPRKGENLYKRKDGRWEGRYIKKREGNKKVYGSVYAKTYTEAKQKLRLKQSESITGNSLPATIAQGVIIFSTVANQWLISIKSNVKISTWTKYYNMLMCHILPILGNQPVQKIDYELLSEWCTELLITGGKQNKGLSSKTISDGLAIIKAVLRYAARKKIAIDQTAFDVSVKLKPSPLRVFSRLEEQRLFEALIENLDQTSLGILICMFTGIRIGELCALTWKDISLEKNTIHIRKTMQRIQTPDGPNKTAIFILEPKSPSSIREIPIAKVLKEYLQQFQRKDGYVLSGNTYNYVEPRTVQNRFKVIMKNCNIENASFHTLRHTFATRCIEIGFDIKSVSEILGHANVNITLNRYVHPSMDSKQKNMDVLSELFIVK